MTALYRCSFNIIRRSEGRSVVNAASYRSAERLHEHAPDHARSVSAAVYRSGEDAADFAGRTYSHRRSDVVHAEILLPPEAPSAFADRETLWNAVEHAERRADAQLARECLVTLPREIPQEDRVALALDFAQEQFVSKGMIADVCVHEKPTRDGAGLNSHAHILLSMRDVGPDGFGKKNRGWNDRALVNETREAWADHVNRALERHEIEGRVSHLSLERQLEDALAAGDFDRAAEVDRLPGVHLGPHAAALERKGTATDLGDELRAIREENARRAEAYAIVRDAVEQAGPEAAAEFLAARQQAEDPVAALDAWGEWLDLAIERVRELAHDVLDLGREAVEHVKAAAVSLWDQAVEAMFAEMAEPEQARDEPELPELPEMGSDDWLDLVIDEAIAEGRTARDRSHEHDLDLER